MVYLGSEKHVFERVLQGCEIIKLTPEWSRVKCANNPASMRWYSPAAPRGLLRQHR